jgi:hypothetical protein
LRPRIVSYTNQWGLLAQEAKSSKALPCWMQRQRRGTDGNGGYDQAWGTREMGSLISRDRWVESSSRGACAALRSDQDSGIRDLGAEESSGGWQLPEATPSALFNSIHKKVVSLSPTLLNMRQTARHREGSMSLGSSWCGIDIRKEIGG